MPFLAEPAFAHGTPARTAILLVNLLSPHLDRIRPKMRRVVA